MQFVSLFVRNIQLISTIFNCFLLFQIHITKNITVGNRLLVSKCDSPQVSHQVLRKVLRKYTQISCGRSGRRIQSGFWTIWLRQGSLIKAQQDIITETSNNWQRLCQRRTATSIAFCFHCSDILTNAFISNNDFVRILLHGNARSRSLQEFHNLQELWWCIIVVWYVL